MKNLEDLGIKVVEEILKIHGLKGKYVLIHVSDSHLAPDSELDSEEVRAKCAERRTVWATPTGALQEELLAAAVEFADAEKADLLCCTGDIVNACHKGSVDVLGKVMGGRDRIIFTNGNHEKSTTDIYLERREEISGIFAQPEPEFHAVDLGEIVVIAVDNSDLAVTCENIKRMRSYLYGDKPVILLHHIPLPQKGLIERAIEIGRGIDYFILGHNGKWDGIDGYMRLVSEEKTALKAILCGHIHFAHTEAFENGVVQYVAAPGFEGYLRKLVIVGDGQ